MPSFIGKAWVLYILLGMILVSCRKGEPISGNNPETSLFLEEIRLPDSLRLSTVVKLYWKGFVQNGYITGYEISTNSGSTWGYTHNTDSTFVFLVPPGEQVADIQFMVRSLDNYGRKDPSPATLKIPVKNTPPVLVLTDSIPDSVYTVFSMSWNLTDIDGDATLDSVQLRMNGGEWVGISSQTQLITFLPESASSSGVTNLKLLGGTTGKDLGQKLPGAVLEGMNQLMIRGKDKSGAFSNEEVSRSFYLRKIHSDLLVIDVYPSDPSARSLYKTVLDEVYPGYDFVSFYDNNRKYQPKYWNIAFKEWISLYDKVFWYSSRGAYNGTEASSGLMLETAAQSLQSYLNQGGKLLVISSLPGIDTNYNFVPTSPIFTLLPIDTLSTSLGQARMQTDSSVVPVNGVNYPLLQPSQFLTGVSPFHPEPGTDIIYRAQITPSQGWVGPRVVGVRQRGTNGKAQLFYFSLDMHYLNGGGTVPMFFNRVLKEEFGL